MSRGFQPDPIKEHARLTELTHLMGLWAEAERQAAVDVQRAISEGVRSNVIAEHFGWSKATLYRWLAKHPPKQQPARTRKKQSRNRAA